MIRHDIILCLHNAPATVLKHVDDTLIVMKACVVGAAWLCRIPDQFVEATRFVINFTKSTLVAVHVEPPIQDLIVGDLGCAACVFPQMYLGLPLSWKKVRFSDFLPMIAKVDKYLVGWVARLLSPAGHHVLINVVLDDLPTYAMAVLRELDGLRRSFLWNVAERASRAQCGRSCRVGLRPRSSLGSLGWVSASS